MAPSSARRLISVTVHYKNSFVGQKRKKLHAWRPSHSSFAAIIVYAKIMPSARPKLVEEGVPITASEDVTGSGTADIAMVEDGDHHFVVGGPQQQHQQQGSSLLNASSGSLFSKKEPKKRASSLAKASKGSLLTAASKKGTGKSATQTSFVVGDTIAAAPSATKNALKIQHSYVVGGNTTASSSSHYKDENNNNGESASHTMMMVDDDYDSHQNQQHGSTVSSFQMPTKNNPHAATNNNHDHDTMDHSHSSHMHIDPTSTPTVATSFVVHPCSNAHAPSYIVGEPQHYPSQQQHQNPIHEDEGVEKMEGVIDLSEKPPMVVLDGANIAYAYSNTGTSSLQASSNKPEPDAHGVVVACHYFLSAGIRVLAVVPSTWTHREPFQSILKKLSSQGLVVPAPPKDDDDAYAITIARREDGRAQQRGDGPGYVLSNDQFRDAIAREEAEGSTDLKEWLTEGRTLPQGKTGPGRISFAFCDVGNLDDHGDKVLDLLPNPRHPLVQFVEQHRVANHLS